MAKKTQSEKDMQKIGKIVTNMIKDDKTYDEIDKIVFDEYGKHLYEYNPKGFKIKDPEIRQQYGEMSMNRYKEVDKDRPETLPGIYDTLKEYLPGFKMDEYEVSAEDKAEAKAGLLVDTEKALDNVGKEGAYVEKFEYEKADDNSSTEDKNNWTNDKAVQSTPRYITGINGNPIKISTDTPESPMSLKQGFQIPESKSGTSDVEKSYTDKELFAMNDDEKNVPDSIDTASTVLNLASSVGGDDAAGDIGNMMTTGNTVSAVGGAVTSVLNSAVTLANYLTTRPRQNSIRGFGNRAQTILEKQKGLVRSQYELLGADIALKERTAKESARLGSRGTNTLFAKELGLHEANLGTARRVKSDYLNKLIGIGSQQARLAFTEDFRTAANQQRIDELGREDKDNMMSQLSRNIVDTGEYVERLGAGMNQSLYNEQSIEAINKGASYTQWNNVGNGKFDLSQKEIIGYTEDGKPIYKF